MTSDFKEKYRELVENVNSSILCMDVNGKITFINEFAQKFFGYPEQEILGQSVIDTIVPPSDFTGYDLRAMIKDIMVNPQKYINNENENVTRDGRHVWISWTNKPVFDQAGHLQEILCIGNDISRLKKAELELAAAKELAEAAGHVGTVICSPDWQIKAINSAAKRYLRLDNTVPAGLDILALILKTYQTSISEDQIRNFSVLRQTFDLIRLETENNKALYLQVIREVLKDQQQEIVSLVLSIQDITEQRREELLKQNFLGLISHKLRTPITVIQQTALLLQQDDTGILGETQKSFVKNILEESYKLGGLVANLLNFVTINNQDTTPAKEPLRVAERLPQAVKAALATAKGKKVDLNIDGVEKDLVLHMGRTCFDLLVSNLVDNAIKFSDQDNVKINITIKKELGAIVLIISDNGPGIPVEEQEKIFDKFYQIEKYFTGNVTGAGLGLALVKKIVTTYGGTIKIKSDIDQGTTFTITLPEDSKEAAHG